jgi:hypothetical protein
MHNLFVQQKASRGANHGVQSMTKVSKRCGEYILRGSVTYLSPKNHKGEDELWGQKQGIKVNIEGI